MPEIKCHEEILHHPRIEPASPDFKSDALRTQVDIFPIHLNNKGQCHYRRTIKYDYWTPNVSLTNTLVIRVFQSLVIFVFTKLHLTKNNDISPFFLFV